MAKGYLLPAVVDPPDTKCVRVEVPAELAHTLAFWGALDTLGYWFNWERDDAHTGTEVAQVWRKVIAEARLNLCNPILPAPPTNTSSPCTCGLVIIEKEDDMTNIHYEKKDGVPQIGFDCGCGKIDWYLLSPVTPPEAAYKKLSGGQDELSVLPFNTPVPDVDVPCYGAAAVDWIFERAIDMNDFLVDSALLGADAYSGVKDELVEWLVLFADLFNGKNDIVDLVQISKEQTAEVFGRQTLKDLMISHWTFTGEVSRQELWDWVKNAPYILGGVQVRLLLVTWLGYGIISGYNRTLAEIAAGCTSEWDTQNGGIPGAGGVGPGGSTVTPFTYLGTDYLAYSFDYDPVEEVPTIGTWFDAPTVPGDALSVYFEFDCLPQRGDAQNDRVDATILLDEVTSGYSVSNYLWSPPSNMTISNNGVSYLAMQTQVVSDTNNINAGVNSSQVALQYSGGSYGYLGVLRVLIITLDDGA